jgi:hypothetical protein
LTVKEEGKMATKFSFVKLTGITVNVKKGEIHLSAIVQFNDENFAKAQTLRHYLEAETGGVTLVIEPRQPSLMDAEITASVSKGEK